MSVDAALALMDQTEAQRITERIRLTLGSVADGMDRLAALVVDAYSRRADLALGYGSWQEYAAGEFGEQTQGLAPAIRRQLVGALSAEGLSTRAIAPAVGVSFQQVAKDQVSPNATPAPAVGVSVGTVHSDRAAGVQKLNTSPDATVTTDLGHLSNEWTPATDATVTTDDTRTDNVEDEQHRPGPNPHRTRSPASTASNTPNQHPNPNPQNRNDAHSPAHSKPNAGKWPRPSSHYTDSPRTTASPRTRKRSPRQTVATSSEPETC